MGYALHAALRREKVASEPQRDDARGVDAGLRRFTWGSATVLTGGSTYVYVTSMEEISISGRQRLLLTTRDEELEIGHESSQMLLHMFAKEGKVLLVHPIDGEKPPKPPIGRGTFARRWAYVKSMSKDNVDRYLTTTEGRDFWLASEAGGRVMRAAYRLVNAVKRSSDLPDGVEKLDWKLHVIHDQSVPNAMVLPNGHIFVFTGILPFCPSEDTFGFLLGHECAHAILRHAGEKISETPFLEMLSTLVISAVSLMVPEEFGGTFFQGVLLRLGLQTADTLIVDAGFAKRYSRDHETEADEVGILLAARACYDPHDAQHLFYNLAKIAPGARRRTARPRPATARRGTAVATAVSTPGGPSTHPDSKHRERAMQDREQLAMAERERCGCGPVDYARRKRVHKALHAADQGSLKRYKSVSCSERHGQHLHCQH